MSTPSQVIVTTTTASSLTPALVISSAASTVTPFSTRVVATKLVTAQRPSQLPVSAPMFNPYATFAAPLYPSLTHVSFSSLFLFSFADSWLAALDTFSNKCASSTFNAERRTTANIWTSHCPLQNLRQRDQLRHRLRATIGAAATSSSIYRFVSPSPLVAPKKIYAKSYTTFGSRAVANGTTSSATPTPLSSIRATCMQGLC